MSKNPLLSLEAFGQSVWLDYLSRESLNNGEIQGLIDKDGISGLTSNPSIFEKAITGSQDYDNTIQSLALEGHSVEEIYEALTIADIQQAADLFRPIYDRQDGSDGFVSLEVSPKLAHETASSIAEGRKLWAAVNRPNLLIKVPGTKEGLPVIQQLVGEGINVNITLLFGLSRYQEVADAYLAGLEMLAAQGKPLNHITSVASFFLSRIDALIDPTLDELRHKGGEVAEIVAGLHGQVAIASAKVAYQMYQEIFTGERFQKLSELGAHSQRLLWASTGTKNPDYSDVMYIEALIGSDTINTIPIDTLNAYRDHGKPVSRLEEGTQQAYQVLNGLDQAGVDLDAMTQQLEDEGVAKFTQAYSQLVAALQEKKTGAMQKAVKP